MVGTGVNISERERTEQALRCAGERLALLLESMGDGVIGVAGDGRWTFVNGAGAALRGCRSEDVVGKKMPALLDTAEERVPAALSCLVSPMALDGQAAGAVIVLRAGAPARA